MLNPYVAGGALSAGYGVIRGGYELYRRYHPYSRSVYQFVEDNARRNPDYSIQSRTQQRFGPSGQKRVINGQDYYPAKKIKQSVNSNTSGITTMDRQHTRFRSGPRNTKRRRVDDHKLLKTVTVPLRWRWQAIKDTDTVTGSNCGYQALGHFTSTYNTVSYRELPLQLISVTNVPQDNTNTYVSYTLLNSGTTNYCWKVNQGLDVNAGATYSPIIDRTDSSTVVSIGRKSMLDWYRLRLNLWGKKLAPTRVRVSLVRFSKEEMCPEFYDFSGTVPVSTSLEPNAASEYEATLKSLITNPIATKSDPLGKSIKVIRSWNFYMNPSNTTDADLDANNKIIDIFYRPRMVVDYTTSKQYDLNVQGIDKLTNATAQNVPDDRFSNWPGDLTRGLYFMITAYAPVIEGSTPAYPMSATMCSYQNCYDINLAVQHVTLQAPNS